MLLSFMIVGGLLKGFFWSFLKVRLSFGKLVLIKIREVNRDLYRKGEVLEGFLVYTLRRGEEKRLAIPKGKSVFYRTLGITMIDVDGETNAICCVDYSAVTGFDAVKYNNLYLRALYKPAIVETQEKVIIVLIIVAVIVGIIGVFMLKDISPSLSGIHAKIDAINRGIITRAGGL